MKFERMKKSNANASVGKILNAQKRLVCMLT